MPDAQSASARHIIQRIMHLVWEWYRFTASSLIPGCFLVLPPWPLLCLSSFVHASSSFLPSSSFSSLLPPVAPSFVPPSAFLFASSSFLLRPSFSLQAPPADALFARRRSQYLVYARARCRLQKHFVYVRARCRPPQHFVYVRARCRPQKQFVYKVRVADLLNTRYHLWILG